MNINQMNLGPLGTNCYIISSGKHALIIDPGGEAEKVISYLTAYELTPEAILLTHTHFDHIGGVDTLRKHYTIDVYSHEAEKQWLNDSRLNGSQIFMGSEILTSQPDKYLVPGPMTIGDFHFDIRHTPGHSPGSVSFVFQDDTSVIGGDVLFNSGIGRTDLPGGNFAQIKNSIRTKLYTLPDHYKVYPGHGPVTEIGHEKSNNPFVQA